MLHSSFSIVDFFEVFVGIFFLATVIFFVENFLEKIISAVGNFFKKIFSKKKFPIE